MNLLEGALTVSKHLGRAQIGEKSRGLVQISRKIRIINLAVKTSWKSLRSHLIILRNLGGVLIVSKGLGGTQINLIKLGRVLIGWTEFGLGKPSHLVVNLYMSVVVLICFVH